MTPSPAEKPRRSRRAQRPATDGVPERDRVDRDGQGDDAGDDEHESADGAGEDRSETWWREQRPPHWE